MVTSLSVTETTPFAGDWRVGVSSVKLDILDRVAKTLLVDSSASDYVSIDLDDRQVVD